MKCNDCIYEKMCEGRYEREHCYSFKDKANFVEVVRCKDCIHSSNMPLGLCYLHTEPYDNAKGYKGDAVCVEPNDYCSCGERREG